MKAEVTPSDRTPLLLTGHEVARILRVTPRTVRRLAADGELRRVRVGTRTTRYRQSDLDALIDRQVDPAHGPDPHEAMANTRQGAKNAHERGAEGGR